MNSTTAYRILHDLLAETGPYTGEAFLKASVKAFAKPFNADFVFITQTLASPRNTVRMLAAWRDGGEVAGWDFTLPGTPCELIYQDDSEQPWDALRIGNAVAIPEQVCRNFASTQDTTYQAFIGLPLWDSKRNMIGHIALFFERDLTDAAERSVIVELVELFSYKVQAELNRMILEQAREAVLIELKNANERLARDSITDTLTQLYNRRHFNQRINEAFAHYKRLGQNFALLLLDLDHFKSINDLYGHDIGDTVLAKTAAAITACTRADVETLFRIGGEEFAVICRGRIERESLLELGVRINHAVKKIGIVTNEHEVSVTVSIGAALPQQEDAGWNAIYVRADKALYAAKDGGRDRTVIG